MDQAEMVYLPGAAALLKECDRTLESLFARYERAADSASRREVAEAALYELKIRAAIEDLILHPAFGPETFEPGPGRRKDLALIDKLRAMNGEEWDHDALFGTLRRSVRRRIREDAAREASRAAPCPHGVRLPVPA